jgi:hypothetical protein
MTTKGDTKRAFDRVRKRFKAMVESVKRTLPVEVYLSPARPPGASGSNVVIAANLKARSGKDPLELPERDRKRIQKALIRQLRESIIGAFKKKKVVSLNTILLIAANDVVKALRARIIGGHLGSNPGPYKLRKRAMVTQGLATSKYGNPPPFGIQTGGFLAAIRARVKR